MKNVNEFVQKLSNTNDKKLLNACKSFLTDRHVPYAVMYVAKYAKYESNFDAFGVIAASIGNKVGNTDSYVSLGHAISKLDSATNKGDTDSIRMDRILRAQNTEEVIEQYVKLIHMLKNKNITLNHTHLLKDFIFFDDKVKNKWAMDYFKVQEFTDEV